MGNPMFFIMAFVSNFILSLIIGRIIFKISFQLKKYLMFGLLGGFSVYLTKFLLFTLGYKIGLGTPINLIISIFLFNYIFELKDLKQSSIMATLMYVLVLINEILTLEQSLKLFNTNIDIVLNNPMLYLKLGSIQNLGLLMIMLIVYIVKKYAIDRRIVSIDN